MKRTKRFVAWLLTVAMTLSFCPVSVFATENDVAVTDFNLEINENEGTITVALVCEKAVTGFMSASAKMSIKTSDGRDASKFFTLSSIKPGVLLDVTPNTEEALWGASFKDSVNGDSMEAGAWVTYTYVVDSEIPEDTYSFVSTFGEDCANAFFELYSCCEQSVSATYIVSDPTVPDPAFELGYTLDATVGVPGTVTATVSLTADPDCVLQGYDVIIEAPAELTGATVSRWVGGHEGQVKTVGTRTEVLYVGEQLQLNMPAGESLDLFKITYTLPAGADVQDGDKLTFTLVAPADDNNSSVSIGETVANFKPFVMGATKTVTVAQKVTVTFHDGDSTKTQTVGYNKAAALDANTFTKTGYNFAGWATSEGGSVVYADKASVTTKSNLDLYAVWTPGEVSYTVNHFQQNLEDQGYTKKESETLTGTTESQTEAQAKTYEGFTAQSFSQAAVAADGSTVVNIYYNRKTYDVTVNDGVAQPDETDKMYGSVIVAPDPSDKTGHTFVHWTDGNDNNYVAGQQITVTGNVALNAVWREHTYTINFNANGGTGTMEAISGVRYTEAKTLPANTMTRTGYTFAGWTTVNPMSRAAGTQYGNEATVQSLTAEDNGQVTLYALWTPITYTVRFDLNGGEGTVPDPKSATYDAEVVLPDGTGFSRTGYTFKGWATTADATTPMAANSNLTTENGATVTLYAVWSINSYTVTWVVDGEQYETATYEYGAALSQIPEPTKTGHTFSGWSELPATMPAQDVTVTGTFSINSYKVTWLVDGVEYNTATFQYGAALSQIEDPTKTGYTFSGWSELPTTMPANDVTVTGSFTAIDYTITYELNGGTNSAQNPTKYTVEDAITLQDPAKTGYTFEGWYSESTFENKVTGIDKNTTGNKTFYAKWSIIEYAISYELNGGTNAQNPTKYTVEDAISLQDATKTGYTFGGWYSDAELQTPVTGIAEGTTGNKTFYAKWTINEYTVTFKDWDGDVLQTGEVQYGADATAPADPTREGYTFIGWDVAFNNVTTNLTVTAQYEINKYTVIFQDWNGTELKKETVNHGSAATAPANPTREGYTFTGWNKAFDSITGELTVTAQYEINTYTVTFVAGGETVATKTYTVENKATFVAPAVPAKPGYTGAWESYDLDVLGNKTVNAVYTQNLKLVDYWYVADSLNEQLLIVDAGALGEQEAYYVNGEEMFYSTAYTSEFEGCTAVYVYIVDKNAELNLTVGTKNADHDLNGLRATGDVNGNGRTDISDANAVYQMLRAGGGYYSAQALGVRGRLIADMAAGGSNFGDANDALAIVNLLFPEN